MEELTADELHGVLENPDTTREDLVAAATQLGRREGRAEGQAEGRAEGLEERRMLQHLLTMSSDKSAIIIDHMTQQLQTHQEQRQADEKELRTKTAEIAALSAHARTGDREAVRKVLQDYYGIQVAKAQTAGKQAGPASVMEAWRSLTD